MSSAICFNLEQSKILSSIKTPDCLEKTLKIISKGINEVRLP